MTSIKVTDLRNIISYFDRQFRHQIKVLRDVVRAGSISQLPRFVEPPLRPSTFFQRSCCRALAPNRQNAVGLQNVLFAVARPADTVKKAKCLHVHSIRIAQIGRLFKQRQGPSLVHPDLPFCRIDKYTRPDLCICPGMATTCNTDHFVEGIAETVRDCCNISTDLRLFRTERPKDRPRSPSATARTGAGMQGGRVRGYFLFLIFNRADCTCDFLHRRFPCRASRSLRHLAVFDAPI